MTKRKYIIDHPKSMLAKNLQENDWPETAKLDVIGGLNAPDDKRSNLFRALSDSKTKQYTLGGHRQRGTEGWWVAVRR